MTGLIVALDVAEASTALALARRLSPFVDGYKVGLELLSGPAQTTLPLIMLGDFNSAADGSTTATYGLLTAAGLVDTWNAAHPGDPGLTCCQAADLLNATSTLRVRFDVIFTRGNFEVLDSEIVGEELDDRTPAGLWPSDHAGVVSTLRLPRE